MTPVDVLKKARELLAGGWCQQSMVNDSRGVALILPVVEAGCSFCIYGAVTQAGWDHDDIVDQAVEILDDVCVPLGYSGIVGFNDTRGRTQEEVVDLLDVAIGRMK